MTFSLETIQTIGQITLPILILIFVWRLFKLETKLQEKDKNSEKNTDLIVKGVIRHIDEITTLKILSQCFIEDFTKNPLYINTNGMTYTVDSREQIDEVGSFEVREILDYSDNAGDPDVEVKEFDSLKKATEYFNETLQEECTEHGKTCAVQLFKEGDDEPLKEDYQKSKLLPKGAIIVSYKHVTYMNYAYAVLDIKKARDGERYEDLNVSKDTTSATWDDVFDDVNQLKEYYEKRYGIFGRLNKGKGIIEQFLSDEGIAGYKE